MQELRHKTAALVLCTAEDRCSRLLYGHRRCATFRTINGTGQKNQENWVSDRVSAGIDHFTGIRDLAGQALPIGTSPGTGVMPEQDGSGVSSRPQETPGVCLARRT